MVASAVSYEGEAATAHVDDPSCMRDDTGWYTVRVRSVVSQGCRPIGDPMVVTRGQGSLIQELAGRNALERVQSVLRALPPDDVQLAQQGPEHRLQRLVGLVELVRGLAHHRGLGLGRGH